MVSQAKKILLDAFCLRQFQKGSGSFINYDTHSFESTVNDLYIKGHPLKDGYAPFCKHMFIENFIKDVYPSTIEINESSSLLIKTAFEARTDKELPVLRRFVNKTDVQLTPAKYLDVILYSKSQIIEENKAMGNEVEDIDYEYGIISIKPQDVDYELPMDPITMMRNALGKEEGGSGIPLDRKKYLESVEYWSHNVIVK